MLVKKDAKPYINVVPGVRRRTLAAGEKGLMGQFSLEAGAVIPMHSHPHEQIGYLVYGEIVLTIDGKDFLVEAGDSWAIPGEASHGVRVVKPSEVVEVFVPIREDYLD
jgi:quercetin dioxygenase-like cupin family protein